jgi:hypothetical protein
MAAGNAFLLGFIAQYNPRFAQAPARSENLRRPLNLPASRLADILCVRAGRGRLSTSLATLLLCAVGVRLTW